MMLLLLFLMSPESPTISSQPRAYSTLEDCQAAFEMFVFMAEYDLPPIVGYGAIVPARFNGMLRGQCVPREEFCQGRDVCKYLPQDS